MIFVVGVVAGVTVGVIIVSRSSIDFSFLIWSDSLFLYHLTICVAITLAYEHVHTTSYFVIVALCAVSFHF